MIKQTDFKLDKADANSHECVRLETPEGASVEICLFGATIVSLKDGSGNEKIFVSSQTKKNDPKKAIRGGIPIVFPMFGAGFNNLELPSHGFARLCKWTLKNSSAVNTTLHFTFTLTDEDLANQLPAYSKIWPFKFTLSLDGYLSFDGTSFSTSLTVQNNDSKPFSFQALLHTYYYIPDAENLLVKGLDKVKYIDKTDKNTEKVLEGDLSLTSETDWIFSPHETDKEVQLCSDKKVLAKLTVAVDGVTGNEAADIVVWNPWSEKAKGMGDFGDTEWKHMVCVEPGYVSSDATLDANKAWKLIQRISYF